MILFILKCVLSVLTVFIDTCIMATATILAILLWENKWMGFTEHYLFTSILWGKKFNINIE